MKLIIAGGRDYTLSTHDFNSLDALRSRHGVNEVVSGAARGADQDGETWAETRMIPLKRFPADWKAYGRRAGPIRNAQMAAYADAVVLFPGGKGTQSMHDESVKAGIRIFDWRVAQAVEGQ